MTRNDKDTLDSYPEDALVVQLSQDRTYARLLRHDYASIGQAQETAAKVTPTLYAIDHTRGITGNSWIELAVAYARHARLIGTIRVLDGHEDEHGDHYDEVRTV